MKCISVIGNSHSEVILELGAPAKFAKYLKNNLKGVSFLVKLQAEGLDLY